MKFKQNDLALVVNTASTLDGLVVTVVGVVLHGPTAFYIIGLPSGTRTELGFSHLQLIEYCLEPALEV